MHEGETSELLTCLLEKLLDCLIMKMLADKNGNNNVYFLAQLKYTEMQE